MRRATLGEEDPEVVTTLTCLSVELAAMHCWQEAVDMATDALGRNRAWRARVRRHRQQATGDDRSDPNAAAASDAEPLDDPESLTIVGNISNWLTHLDRLEEACNMSLKVSDVGIMLALVSHHDHDACIIYNCCLAAQASKA